jgi:methyl-accepting chemotaxis protein
VSSVQRVTDVMSEISAASGEQTQGIEQVNQAITQMDEVTQQNAALVEEAASASQSLSHQAQRLSELVGVFRLPGAARQQAQEVAVVATAAPAYTPRRPAVAGAAPAATPALAVAQGPDEQWETF